MFKLSPYGVTISVALFVAFYFASYRASKRGLASDTVWDSLPWVFGFGLIGARLYHVLNFLPYYLNNLILIPAIWKGGLGIFGAIIGGLIGVLLSLRNPKSKIQNLYSYLDCAAPAIPLGQAIGRFGNIWNRENLPFAYWEIVSNLLLVAILLVHESFIVGRNKSSVNEQGKLFFLYLISYSTIRFVLEFFRSDSPWIVGPLTMAQWVSLSIFIIALVPIRRLRRG